MWHEHPRYLRCGLVVSGLLLLALLLLITRRWCSTTVAIVIAGINLNIRSVGVLEHRGDESSARRGVGDLRATAM